MTSSQRSISKVTRTPSTESQRKCLLPSSLALANLPRCSDISKTTPTLVRNPTTGSLWRRRSPQRLRVISRLGRARTWLRRKTHHWQKQGSRAHGLQRKTVTFQARSGRDPIGAPDPFLPRVCTEAMDRFLLDFAATIPANTHALMGLDGAGWHDQRSVTVPPNVTLVELLPYSPDLNP